MTKFSKEHLNKLLDFLCKEVISDPENQWFVAALSKALPTYQWDLHENEKLNNVEKYLGLDYKIDSSQTFIDYSFVKSEYLRNCFEADCREMLRCRFGTRGHKREFREVCRYATLQVERATNCYFLTKGETIEDITNYLQAHNKVYSPSKMPENIESIPLKYKLWALKNIFNLENNLFYLIEKITNVRNIQSHGSSAKQNDKEFYCQHRAFLESKGFPLFSIGLVKLNQLTDELKAEYEKNIKKSPNHKRYINLVWEQDQNCDEVLSALSVFMRIIGPHI